MPDLTDLLSRLDRRLAGLRDDVELPISAAELRAVVKAARERSAPAATPPPARGDRVDQSGPRADQNPPRTKR